MIPGVIIVTNTMELQPYSDLLESLNISNSIFSAGFHPVGVHSAHICINFALEISFGYLFNSEDVSENVIKISGEFARKCLHPKQTNFFDN